MGDWHQCIHDASSYVMRELEESQESKVTLETINSGRLQFKFPRSLGALPPALRRVVEVLQARVLASCGEGLQLQDCYALYTPADEIGEEAREPQNWHLDAIKQFPVAALLLRGSRWTEFAAGPYSNFAEGVSETVLEEWCMPWRNIEAATWESESVEEWEHWSKHLHSSGLMTADAECEWSKLEVAAVPAMSYPGDASVFWSNKVHRGPGTDIGEERLVLFCSWMPVGSRPENSKQSETNYSFYDTHLEPKLSISKRAMRSLKRQKLSMSA